MVMVDTSVWIDVLRDDTGAVLIAAKRAGLVKAVAPLLEALQDRGYRLSESLVGAILKRCEEGEER